MIALLAAVAMHWLVLNDVHLNPYDVRPRAVRGEDSNRALVRSAVEEMQREVPDARVIVLGGDFLAHHYPALVRAHHGEPYAKGHAEIEALAKELDHAFPRAQFLVTLGNNDDPCGDYHSEIGGAYAREIAQAFEPLVNRNGAAPTFLRDFARGGYYTARLPAGERAIVLNSVLWSFVYRGSCQVSAHAPGDAEMRWLSHVLDGGNNVIVMHIPPGYDAQSTTTIHRLLAVPFLWAGYDRRFRASLAAHRSHVAFAIAAHTHRYDVRLPADVPMLIASSLSPIYLNNPAFFELNVDDGTLADVVPFAYDLRTGAWLRKPSFDAWYDVHDLSSASLRSVSDRIASDPAYRAKWIAAYDVWSWRIGDISDYRWQTFRCAQIAFGARYARCAGTQRRSDVLVVGAIVGLALLSVAGGVLVSARRRRRARPDATHP